MLNQIQIRNFAIVKTLNLDFREGLNVITGETGAGKSIVVDALGILMGGRADQHIIGFEADRSEISAIFNVAKNNPAKNWLKQNELDDANDECVVRRTFQKDSRSRAYINGISVPIQHLKDLAEFLVDIHGQHEHQLLLKSDIQRQMLDEFGLLEDLSARVAETYKKWQSKISLWQQMQKSSEERANQIAFLSHQIEELENAGYHRGDMQQLESDHAKLANATKLLEISQKVIQAIDADEDQNVLSILNNCEHELSQLAVIDLEVQPISELANAAIIQVNETLTRLRNYASKIDIDPQRLLEVEERIGVIHRLVRKYKIEADEIPTFLQNLQIQLDELQNSDVQRDKIQQDIQNLQQEYCALANELSKKRRSAADRLNRQISEAMQTLGMPGGVFEVELEHLPTEQYQAFGMEKIQFLVSANPGMPAKALAKVASGGELSRISLAIQVCLSQHREMPTLIYDEIDVGIGGATAEIVGLQLRRLSRGRQVLSVTHLPQVAAQGHHQFRVKKKTLKGHTSTEMIELDAEQRVEEIARMLGGVKLTEQTLAHAREMLNTAKIDTKNEAVPSCAET